MNATADKPAKAAKKADTAPAAKAPKVAKVKTTSARVEEIRTAAVALGEIVTYKTFNKSGSFVLKIPKFKDITKALPHSAEAKTALTLLTGLMDSVASLTKGDANATWVFHSSGAFGLYSRM